MRGVARLRLNVKIEGKDYGECGSNTEEETHIGRTGACPTV